MTIEENEEGKDNTIECAEKMKNQKIGFLTVSDYMNASLDPNCKNTVSKTCKNYNYLSKVGNWWLVTADKNDNSKVYQVNQGGKVISNTASNSVDLMSLQAAGEPNKYIKRIIIARPIIYLNSKVLYRSGKGTLENPYKVK